MALMHDVIVIGGGIVGTSAAYHLVCAGAKTLLIDRHDAGRATDAGAGILSAETYSGDCEPWFQLALQAAAYYPDLVDRIAPFADGDVGYGTCPKLTVAAADEEVPGFERAKRKVLERQGRGGRPPSTELYEMSAEEVQRRFPFLAETKGALYFASSARVDGRRLTQAMLQAALARGLSVKEAGVDELVLRDKHVSGVKVGDDVIDAPNVVIAGGAWSSSFEPQLGVKIPVEPQRGLLVHLRVFEGDTSGWPIIEAFRGHYIVPWPDGRVVAGATRETGAGFDAIPTVDGLREVLDEAFRLVPELAGAEIVEMRVGLRPLCLDRLPLLGTVPHLRGVFLATGHGSTGLQLGPYSGKLVAALILGEPTPTDLRPFEVTRFI